jgi:hypothetical protein
LIQSGLSVDPPLDLKSDAPVGKTARYLSSGLSGRLFNEDESEDDTRRSSSTLAATTTHLPVCEHSACECLACASTQRLRVLSICEFSERASSHSVASRDTRSRHRRVLELVNEITLLDTVSDRFPTLRHLAFDNAMSIDVRVLNAR